MGCNPDEDDFEDWDQDDEEIFADPLAAGLLFVLRPLIIRVIILVLIAKLPTALQRKMLTWGISAILVLTPLKEGP